MWHVANAQPKQQIFSYDSVSPFGVEVLAVDTRTTSMLVVYVVVLMMIVVETGQCRSAYSVLHLGVLTCPLVTLARDNCLPACWFDL